MLSLLLQARHDDGSPMSDQELRDELMTLLVAGHETSATALAWALEALARHPELLRRLRDEVDAGEDEYLDAVIKEMLRLRPVIALVLRRLTEPMEIGGRLLPAGVTVAPCIYLVHRRPDIYPEPRAFRPERFLRSRRAPTPGSRLAGAFGAASGRASPSSRSRSCCASWWPGWTCAPARPARNGACAARSCSRRSAAVSSIVERRAGARAPGAIAGLTAAQRTVPAPRAARPAR